jgi:hypothetical protein
MKSMANQYTFTFVKNKKYILALFLFFAFTFVFAQKPIIKNFTTFKSFHDALYNSSSAKCMQVPMSDSFHTMLHIAPDTIRDYFSFKIDNYKLKYTTYRDTSHYPNFYDKSRIEFNNTVIRQKKDEQYFGLDILYSEKITLGENTYIILPSWFGEACNGSLCRAELDQIFEIKNDKVNYQVVLGLQGLSSIYCDLNNDGQLDQITFLGDCASPVDASGEKLYYCVQVLTLSDNQWIPLKDKDNRSYFISFSIIAEDYPEMNSFKILDYNWMTDL